MRLHRALILLGIMILINGFFYAQPPLKIPYQAVIRTPEGEILANQPAVVRTSIILGQPTDDAVFAETHSVTSNPFGVVSLVLGNGTTIAGNFDEINWKAGVAFLKIEIDYQNTGSYTLIGVSQILSVPYALKSGNSLDQLSGQQGQIISHDGADWQAYDKVWVNPGVVTVDGAPTKNPEDPIFQIKNQAGEVLFTVNSQGVEVKLADSGEEQGSLRVQGLSATEPFLVISPDSALVQFNTDGIRAEKGGFAVGGLSTGKPVSTPYFMLEPAMTTLNFDKAAATKAEKGGFAVGGLSSGKLVTSIFTIEQDCTRMYIASELERAEKGGFAVGGLSTGKPLGQEYFRLSSVGAQVTFDEDLQRAEKGGFAVGGLSSGKTVARDYLNLSQEQVKFSMAERDEKSGLGGFTIGGYMDNGEQYTSFFNLNPISVIINTGSVTTGEIVIGGDVNVGGEIIFQPEVSTDYYAEVTETTALAFGTLYADGGGAISAFGFVWDTLPETTVERYLGQCVMPEVQFLPFWCQLTGLDSATTYYVRAFATNSAGTAYGSEFEFTTLTGWEDKPTATAPSVSDMTDYSALFLTTVENPFAITMISKGFVVNLTGNPTRSVNNGMFETEALEAGELSGEISELMADTLYYARAFVKFYADVENGIEATFYSEQTTFRTQPNPSITTGNIIEVKDVFSKIEFTVTRPENTNLDYYGFIWDTLDSPSYGQHYCGETYYDNLTVSPMQFVDSLRDLMPNRTYYAKPFVSHFHGYSYGEQIVFTTLSAPSVSTDTVLAASDISIEASATINTNGCQVFNRGFVINTTGNPTFDVSEFSSLEDYSNDTFTDIIEVSQPGTTYYVRAYIIHNSGISYGEERMVTTFLPPQIETGSAVFVNDVKAAMTATVINPNSLLVYNIGFVWSDISGPTINGNAMYNYDISSGIYTDTLFSLIPEKIYYVRAFIEHNGGLVYGNEVTFNTKRAPAIDTTYITDTTYTSVSLAMQIDLDENVEFFDAGFVYDTQPNPTFEEYFGWLPADSVSPLGFAKTMEGLEPGTQYYTRAYIEHYGGFSYGEILSVTTKNFPSAHVDTIINITQTSATVDYTLIDCEEDVTGFGLVWGENIEIENDGTHFTLTPYEGQTSFSETITGLTPGTQYYVRPYVEFFTGMYDGGNPVNLYFYGDPDSLETVPLPPVVIDTVDATTFFSAWAHATINENMVVSNKTGFIWSQNEEFTHATASDTAEMVWGSMGGTFDLELEWLLPGTQYYVKAFIITENSDTLYSASYGFTTQPSPVITNPVEEPTADGAFVTAMISHPENQYPSRNGFVWGITSDIDLANKLDSCQLGYVAPETFHYLITGLTENTVYYVKAWAEILDSIYYGEAQPFTTQPVYGTVTDASGFTYPTKYIGRYNWMTQNLRTLKYSDGTDLPFETDYREPAIIDSLLSFGRLYSFNAVLRHHTHQLNSKICPTGWRLPEYNEWQNLIETTGFYQWNASPYLKAVSEAWMTGEGSAPENTTGFSALPAGKFVIETPPGSHGDVGQNAYFWSEPYGEDFYYSEIRYLGYSTDEVLYEMYNSEFPPVFLSVRCLKTTYTRPELFASNMPEVTHNSVYRTYDVMKTGYTETGVMGVVVGNAPNPTIGTHFLKTEQPLKQGSYSEVVDGLTPGTTYYIRVYAANERDTVYTDEFEIITDTEPSVFDNAGNKYPIVTIGSQQWMGANLRTNFYNNGQSINGSGDSYPYYVEPWQYFDLYGMYYQHGVVTDPRGICPNGWGIPRDEDWNQLIIFVGGFDSAGKILKSDSVSAADGFWESSALPGTNAAGFNALPAGYYSNESILEMTLSAHFWSRWQSDLNQAQSVNLSYDSDGIVVDNTTPTSHGYSVRCVRDNPTKTYTANVLTTKVEVLTPAQAVVLGRLIDAGNAEILRHGICYGLSPNPDTTGTKEELGTSVTDFTAEISGLTGGASYYFRAYVENSKGLSYGQDYPMTMPSFQTPTIETVRYEDLTFDHAIIFGNIVSDGYAEITEAGFVWGTNPNPELNTDDSIKVNITFGEYSAEIHDLIPGQTYYFRAYATNSVGTAYGADMNFTTLPFGGAGTLENPYQVFTLNSLVHLSETPALWAANFIQMADINASETLSMNEGAGFSPIGNDVTSFMGSYNGNGNQISNLSVNRSANQYIGLFGYANNATLKGITLTDVTVTGGSYSGALVGMADAATIDSCFVSGQIAGTNENTGGVVGYSGYSKMKHLSFEGVVSGLSKTGGIVGLSNHDTVRYCRANVILTASGNAGGIVGRAENYTFIEQCFSHGSVSENNMGNAGGLVGLLNDCVIRDSYSNAHVTGVANTAGFIGSQTGNAPSVINCYSTGLVIGSDIYGGFCASVSGEMTNCYWDIDASQQPTGNGAGLTNEEMKLQSSFEGFDFGSVWAIENGVSYPYFQWQGTPGEHNYSTIVKDIDGNVYRTTKIGEQEWFTSNLKTTKLNTGVDILEETSSSWEVLTVPGYCYYNNETGNLDAYGALYNFKAVETGSICPTGWHVPSDAEWTTLETYLANNGFVATQGTALKSIDWSGGTDNFGFNALPGGWRDTDGTYYDLTAGVKYWTSTPSGENRIARVLLSANADIQTGYLFPELGSYIRCLKNTTKFTSGDGTVGNPYQINNLNDLNELANSPETWDKHFEQTDTIRAYATIGFNGGMGWKPIGSEEVPFRGVYDGKGFKIDSLYISNAQSDIYNMALFGATQDATIKNLGIVAANISASMGGGVAGLIGYAENTTVEKCYVSGAITGASGVGALIGYADNSTILQSYGNANIMGMQMEDAISGLIGAAYKTVIKDCYVRGNLFGSGYLNGLAFCDSGMVVNSYSAIMISGGEGNGGLVSAQEETMLPKVKFSFYDSDYAFDALANGASPKSTLEMQMAETFIRAGWDFKGWGANGVWNIGNGQNEGYPYLSWQSPADPDILPADMLPGVYTYKPTEITTTSATFNGEMPFLGAEATVATQYGFCWNTTGNPTTSDSKVELGAPLDTLTFSFTIATLTFNRHYYVRAFATNGESTAYGDVVEFFTLPIEPVAPALGDGSPENPYQIANLANLFWVSRNLPATPMNYIHCIQTDNIDASETETWYDGAGWPVISPSINKPYQGYYKGKQHVISNLFINRPDADHPVGLFGWPNATLIDSLGLENVNITGKNNVGAFVGTAWNSTQVVQCYVTGVVNGQNVVGGLIGHNNGSFISNSYSVANVNGIDTVGGLLGYNESLNYTIGYCAGKVTGTGTGNVGGITGASFNDMSSNNNCFWDSLATSQLTSAEGSGYGTPEMVIPGTYWSFNFESGNIWGIVGSESYPYLLWQGDPAEFNTPAIVQDIEGNVYKTVKIGEQVWMAENLKTTKLNTGLEIPNVIDNGEWSTLYSPGYCWYNNDFSTFGETYGALYNWFSAETSQLCPIGWHIPSDNELTELSNFLGGDAIAGGKLKESGLIHWNSPNTGATNESGFTFLPSGYRVYNGSFDYVGNYGFLISSTEYSPEYVWYRDMSSGYEYVFRNYYDKRIGFSVRCLKNAQKFSSGTGTELDPYIITTLADLNELAQSPGTWDKHFRQDANISAAATEYWYENLGWKPIGTTTNHFTGTYDGNGHSIDSLYINRTGELNVGLFGFAMNATLKNLTIKAQNIAANGNAGTLVGNMNSGVIDNCHANTIVASAGDNGGVLIGVAYSTTISGCSSMGSVSSDGWCGGLIGSCSDSHVLQSFSASNVNGNAADAGGFIGKIDGISEISNCYATGSVSTTTGKVGGFIGTNNGATITNCFSTGMVTGESLVGGFVGEVTGGTLATSYWDTESCGQEASAGGEGKTNLEMSQQASFEGWDFATIWSIDEEVSTPYLQWQTAPGKQNFTRFVTDLEGNRYKIARIGTQVWMRENLRANKLNNGIDISLVEDNSAWGSATTPAYCYSQNNIIYKANKGTLYNGFTVSSGNICPVGWRVPSVTDWETLKTHVGTNFPGSEGDALKLESMWWTDLGDPYSFSAIHSGYRAIDGQFWNDADDAFYWTNTEETSGVLYFYSLTNTDALLTQGQYSSVRGNSVRCIRNETKFFGGDGTVGTPYLISSLADLNELAQSPETWDKYFEQTQDIVATETNTWHAGAGWMPIGDVTTPFTGNYSGGSYSISNLYMYRDGTQYTGFFGVCDNATISNMVLSEVDFTAGSTLGGLSGSIGNTTIQNCATTGSINGNGFMGGIVGYCSNSQILNSYSASNIAASGTDVGGLAGKTENTSLVENCYSTGEVIAGDYVGGLIGRNENSTISNCYSLGMVTQATTHGGLVSTNTGTITNSYWNRTTSGANVSAGGTGLVNIKFGKKKTFEGWDFTTIWAIDEFDTYPHFQWQSGPEEHNMPVISPFNFVEDADLNKYGIIYIGSQAWMDENLRTTKYTDGTAIPEETDNATWNAFDNGARRCWYNNDSTNNAGTYGSLYSFFTIDPATNGGKQLCPTGWHPATDSDWSSLITFLGTEGHTGNEGTVLKAQTGWSSGNGTDNYGFEGFPGGKRDSSMGDFVSFLSEGYWWRSEFGADDANDIAMGTGTELFPYVNSKREGKSVRCVQNY